MLILQVMKRHHQTRRDPRSTLAGMIARSQSCLEGTPVDALPKEVQVGGACRSTAPDQSGTSLAAGASAPDVDALISRFSGYLVHLQGNSRPKNNEFHQVLCMFYWFFQDRLTNAHKQNRENPNRILAAFFLAVSIRPAQQLSLAEQVLHLLNQSRRCRLVVHCQRLAQLGHQFALRAVQLPRNLNYYLYNQVAMPFSFRVGHAASAHAHVAPVLRTLGNLDVTGPSMPGISNSAPRAACGKLIGITHCRS